MTITANLCDNAGFFGDDRPLGSAAIVSYGPFVQACKAFPEARSMCHLCLFEAKRPIFLAKRPTLLAKHNATRLSLACERYEQTQRNSHTQAVSPARCRDAAVRPQPTP